MNQTSCPKVYFSAEHRNFIHSNSEPITLENISYKANINNYSFNSKCLVNDKIFTTNLSILFIVTPDEADKRNFLLPYYVAILNSKKEIIDIQYYITEGTFKLETGTKEYIETEVASKVSISVFLSNYDINSENNLIIGFMLDNKKLEILN